MEKFTKLTFGTNAEYAIQKKISTLKITQYRRLEVRVTICNEFRYVNLWYPPSLHCHHYGMEKNKTQLV